MAVDLSDEALSAIDRRLRAALDVVGPPWTPQLETQAAIGGSSFIQGGRPDTNEEIYIQIALGESTVASPDERLDAVVAFLGHAAGDIEALLAEVRRARGK